VSHSPFYTRYGLTRTGDREVPLVLDAYPEILHHGRLRAAIAAAAIDLVGSLFTREVAGTDILYTTDLSLRLPHAGPSGRLRARGRSLRSGRTGSTTAVELVEEVPSGERVWAYGETTFARMPRATSATLRPEDLALPRVFARNPLERPLVEVVGIETIDAQRGEVELALRPAVLNTEGTLQGALVALVVERAAEVMAERARAGPQWITELDLRYLATAKQGPLRSRGAFVGPAEEGMLRVALRDAGREERVTATALLRVAPAR
jgi:acyl-coenzyme A thioesterase PaaI-like protein